MQTPLVIVAGFLGAGKTTALRQSLPAFIARGWKPALILNDLENARVDASLFAELSGMVTPVDGSCMCCGDPTELFDALRAIPEEEGRIVFLEANGASDVLALLEMVAMSPSLARFRPVRCFAVVDVERWGTRGPYAYLEADQVKAAVAVWINRGAGLAAEERERRHAEILECAQGAKVCEPVEWADLVADTSRPAFRVLAPARSRQSPVHELAHSISVASLSISSYSTKDDVERWMGQLPDSVIRVKGVLTRPPHSWVFQRIEGGFTHWERLSFSAGIPDVAVLIGAALGEVPAMGESL